MPFLFVWYTQTYNFYLKTIINEFEMLVFLFTEFSIPRLLPFFVYIIIIIFEITLLNLLLLLLKIKKK